MSRLTIPEEIRELILEGDPAVGDTPIWADSDLSEDSVVEALKTSMKDELLEIVREQKAKWGKGDSILCTEVWACGARYYISLCRHEDGEGYTYSISMDSIRKSCEDFYVEEVYP